MSLSLQCLHLLCLPPFRPQKVGDSSCHLVHLCVNARRRAATFTLLVRPCFNTRRVGNPFHPCSPPFWDQEEGNLSHSARLHPFRHQKGGRALLLSLLC